MPKKPPVPIYIVTKDPKWASEVYARWIIMNREINKEEYIYGDLAVGLQLFDHFWGKCKEGECPDSSELNDKVLEILSHLSIGKCIEMKAYHIWDDKIKPTKDPKGIEDYESALNEIINLCEAASCPKEKTSACTLFLNRIKDFYRKRPQSEWVEKKKWWCSLADPLGNPHTHYQSAKRYVEDFYRFLEGEKPSSLREFVEKNLPMISALAFLYLFCLTK